MKYGLVSNSTTGDDRFKLLDTYLYLDKKQTSTLFSDSSSLLQFFDDQTFLFRFEGVPRTVSIIQPFILYVGLIGWRYLFKIFLNSILSDEKKFYAFNVLIFSNLDFVDQAVKALETSKNYKVYYKTIFL